MVATFPSEMSGDFQWVTQRHDRNYTRILCVIKVRRTRKGAKRIRELVVILFTVLTMTCVRKATALPTFLLH
jgi:hypothetical protein